MERAGEATQERGPVREVVIRVHDQREATGARRKQRVVGEAEDRRDVADAVAAQPRAERVEHRRLRIDRVDAPGRTHGAREP